MTEEQLAGQLSLHAPSTLTGRFLRKHTLEELKQWASRCKHLSSAARSACNAQRSKGLRKRRGSPWWRRACAAFDGEQPLPTTEGERKILLRQYRESSRRWKLLSSFSVEEMNRLRASGITLVQHLVNGARTPCVLARFTADCYSPPVHPSTHCIALSCAHHGGGAAARAAVCACKPYGVRLPRLHGSAGATVLRCPVSHAVQRSRRCACACVPERLQACGLHFRMPTWVRVAPPQHGAATKIRYQARMNSCSRRCYALSSDRTTRWASFCGRTRWRSCRS